MNVQGVFTSAGNFDVQHPSRRDRLRNWIFRHRYLMMLVFAPTFTLAIYYYLIASYQYESEAHFIVNSGSTSTNIPSSGLGQMLGMSGGLSGAQGQVLSVADYLQSHDAVETLNQRTNLVEVFRRPGTDLWSRLWFSDPTPESMLRYYRGKVRVHFDRDTGITTLKVRTFRRDDSYRITEELLRLGEARVNQMNRRSYNDAVAMARAQLARAEEGVAEVQRRITGYRQQGRDIDPQATGEAQTRLVTDLRGNLAAAQAQLESMGATISRSSPQYVALARHVAALRAEMARQSAQLTGIGPTIARNLGGYEDLKVRQEFVAKRYESAAAAFDKARQDAQRQQLYLVRVVNPNRPVKALYPERTKIVLTVLVGLLLTYGIGWLIVAGVREHAA
jgi:capsular polysaccharide transport system permease protein